MSIDNAIASVAVTDLAESAPWYDALLQRAADSTPMDQLAEWKFPRGGWLQVYESPERAGGGSVTLAVTGLEGIVKRLEKLGVDTSRQTSGPKAVTLTIADPDGNQVTLAEALDPNIAQ